MLKHLKEGDHGASESKAASHASQQMGQTLFRVCRKRRTMAVPGSHQVGSDISPVALRTVRLAAELAIALISRVHAAVHLTSKPRASRNRSQSS